MVHFSAPLFLLPAAMTTDIRDETDVCMVDTDGYREET